nr:exodeoxyribonuclease V subunit gamma [candidate division KSB1 bacterium]NIR69021.1 exodeoxyribonuclease V subunit gamma [candidate division KSB1 bacterium]NIS24093.1 exodeoxyribonuclease V subunit gamma [candidate division KSB1 bacterium]NIT71012.1 exodeoxyribonuclease V subunit gamma [candidate division KSB1 bacterium]NIU24720.1 exodeoxyribonuclease V subunit gamma [candidate division KSB1 bacterium]
EYWGDIVSESEIRRASKKKDKDLTLDLFHFDKGNSLLASMGKLGRDFFDVIEEQFDYQPFEQFEDPGEHSLLTDLQSDILNLRDRGLTGDPKQAISDTDTSLQIHSCHSPRREIEVLQDHLLHLFETNPDLRPSDILVMTPDIEPVAPYIQSVFDLPFENPKRIPYSIADRSYGREDEIVETFFGILNLQGSRFGAAQVLTILEAPAVQKKFDLSEDDIELIHNWVRDTRIRWGKNAQDRRRLGLPEHAQNTWQAGLERLLLGYALPGRDETLYNGSILPYPHVEGDQSLVLGRFLEFTEYLFEKVDALGKKRMLQQWHTKLDELLDTFFESDDETVAEIQVIRRALVELDGFEHLSGFDEPIELKVVRHHLETKLHREGHGYGFLTGGVTFCSMLPMRSIPARIICLVGMNNDAYPRRNIQLGFDLMAKQPRKGDRSRRNDDRYLFLEALLSAREHLYISYVGQSIKDNSLIPPSVVVGELLDYISANFTTEESRILEHVTTRHRLQAFSPEYFRGGDRLFSYSHENMQAACHLLAPREAPKPFLMERLTEPQKEFKEVRLSDLYRFFRNPCQFLLNRRLGVYLDESTAVLEEKETFALRGLDRYKVAEKLLEKKVAGLDTEDVKRAAIASGQLPHGAVGEYEVDTLNEKLEQFVLKTERYLKGRELEPLGIDLKLNEFHLTGHLDQITQSGLVVYRFARVQAKDHLRVWIQHLALNACAAGATPRESYLAGVDSAKDGNWVGWRFRPLDHSTEILTRLLQIYWEGLREPLRFFPNSAFAFIGRLKQGWKEEWARRSARKRWFGSDSERGEREDLYFQLCFGKEIDPLSQEFQTLASDVFSPVIETEEEISDG